MLAPSMEGALTLDTHNVFLKEGIQSYISFRSHQTQIYPSSTNTLITGYLFMQHILTSSRYFYVPGTLPGCGYVRVSGGLCTQVYHADLGEHSPSTTGLWVAKSNKGLESLTLLINLPILNTTENRKTSRGLRKAGAKPEKPRSGL